MTKISKNIEIGNIIGRYMTGNASQQDLIKLEEWLKKTPQNKRILESIEDENNIEAVVDVLDSVNKEQGWQKLEQKYTTLSLRNQVIKWKIAAMLLFLVGLTGSILGYWNPNPNKSEFVPANHTTVVTENGQKSKIILPDSSVVWLNAGTKLSYNNGFSVNNRNIKLEGEAYFKVQRNELIPLVVVCSDLEVRVLGTEFDVRAFPEEEKISVVLEKGKVELSHINDKFQSFNLEPGEIAVFDDIKNTLGISSGNTYEYISWKDGVLIFNNAMMKDVLTKLEHWYGVDISVTDPDVYDLIFNATIVDENLEDIFSLIKYTCDIDYVIRYSHNPHIPIKITISKKNKN
uniref:FecR family protein n=1 Tax=uncultured Draconibacterium sp. TaxID=1573823 RepID=UPI003216A1CB